MAKKKGLHIPIVSDMSTKTLNNVKIGATILSVGVSIASLAYAYIKSQQKRAIVERNAQLIEQTKRVAELDGIYNTIQTLLRQEKIDEREYLYLQGLVDRQRRKLESTPASTYAL